MLARAHPEHMRVIAACRPPCSHGPRPPLPCAPIYHAHCMDCSYYCACTQLCCCCWAAHKAPVSSAAVFDHVLVRPVQREPRRKRCSERMPRSMLVASLVGLSAKPLSYPSRGPSVAPLTSLARGEPVLARPAVLAGDAGGRARHAAAALAGGGALYGVVRMRQRIRQSDTSMVGRAVYGGERVLWPRPMHPGRPWDRASTCRAQGLCA